MDSQWSEFHSTVKFLAIVKCALGHCLAEAANHHRALRRSLEYGPKEF